MKVDIKIKGIAKRWLYNILPIVFVFIVTLLILAFYMINSYYTGLVAEAVSTYTRSHSTLSLVEPSDFQNAAFQYVEDFPYRDKVEIQIYNNNGTLLASTNLFESTSKDYMPDYKAALISASGEAVKRLTTQTGERCIAGTTVLPDLGHGSNGAYRWVVSIENLGSSMYILYAFCILIGIIFLIFAWLSGQYFIRSIVNPVNKITVAARKIAGGDFDSRLEVNRTDEIGGLCDTINYMASELGQVEKAKNDFISSVSHELRTPLTAIRGWGETVMMSVDEKDEIVKQGMEVILTESERLSRLVEDLLDFSRMQNGRLSVTMGKADLKQILLESIAIYKEPAAKKNIDLSFICEDELPSILADQNRLKQVFINVIDNAVKYSKEDGGNVVISAVPEEACIRVSVSDTGVGIPRADLDKVKEKFYKANQNVRGSGIGLAVADEIIKQHNGLIFVESVEGEGTTVTVVLPTPILEEKASSNYYPPIDEQNNQGETQ